MTIKSLIIGTMYDRGIKADKLAPALHMSRTTFYNRMRTPGRFTITELKSLSRVLKIPIGEILSAAFDLGAST